LIEQDLVFLQKLSNKTEKCLLSQLAEYFHEFLENAVNTFIVNVVTFLLKCNLHLRLLKLKDVNLIKFCTVTVY
jgi:hypothetical protein